MAENIISYIQLGLHAGCNLLLLRFLIQYPAKFQVTTTTTTHWQCACSVVRGLHLVPAPCGWFF